MPKIIQLSPHIANLIAAGEVVERPASVVKELLENAVDAGASKVTVEIRDGGMTFLRVTDNGCGMAPEDLPVAIRRHATSKIKTATDLDGIATLGFRGEALSSIAAVSKLEIYTKTRDRDTGTYMIAENGEITGYKMRCEKCLNRVSVISENVFRWNSVSASVCGSRPIIG